MRGETSTGTTRPVTATGSTTRGVQPRIAWSAVMDVLAMLLLLSTGVVAFGPVFSDVSGYVAAAGGVLLGAVVAVLGAWRRWSGSAVATVAVVVFIVFGGPLALPSTTVGGVLPTLETVNRLVTLTYQAWRDLLTVSVPASSFTGPAVVPYLSGLLCSLVAITIALRVQRHLWALVPTLLLLLIGILWGTKSAPSAAVQGGIFCLTALGWSAWRVSLRQHRDNAHLLTSVRTNTAAQRQRAGAALAILVLASGVAMVVGGGFANATDRYVLRDDVVPPLDLRTYPSPLTRYRYYERNLKEKTLFTVSGLPEGGRVRLAAMDAYDGHVFSVDSATAMFLRVGDRIGVEEPSRSRQVRFEIGDYSGVWLPGGGAVGGVDFDGPAADNLAAGLHYNADSGTLLTTAGLSRGDAYDVLLTMPTPASDERLAKDSVAVEHPVGSVTVPDSVAGITSDFVEAGESQIDQLRKLESKFREVGFYSSESSVSLPGHFAGRLTKLFSESKMVGDDEQYAAAMALMLRQLGYPSRVVLGFYPEEPSTAATVALTGNDAHVWVEVLFEDAGWVVFDPTPDRDKTPDTKVPKPDEVPQPQVLPPPEPPEEPVEAPDDRTDEARTTEKEKRDLTLPRPVRVALLAVAGGGLVATPFVLIALLKTRRRSRRRRTGRTADRISGGWAEILDTADDLGVRTTPGLTRLETARALEGPFPAAGPVLVAERVDSHVFGECDPESADVDETWVHVDRLRTAMRRSVHPVRRLRAYFSLRSLWTRRPRRSAA